LSRAQARWRPETVAHLRGREPAGVIGLELLDRHLRACVFREPWPDDAGGRRGERRAKTRERDLLRHPRERPKSGAPGLRRLSVAVPSGEAESGVARRARAVSRMK